ncbi:BRCT domain-containing protein [Jimgerdemannia flammicorona]|uniref:BRCT domain-containing protein n=1 Tax=Jimgerdemannia flammicorona TaxID=994334 RepID=A0A433Q145_9FUNG|nr:BRCT domain-containing protein [Jimgerdemannia flammicorona]
MLQPSRNFFKDLSICVSGSSFDFFMKLKTIVEYFGGTFQGDFYRYQTTHLLAYNLDSEKCKQAIKWNITIIHPWWIFQCLEQHQIISVSNFKLSGPLHTSFICYLEEHALLYYNTCLNAQKSIAVDDEMVSEVSH